MAIRQKFAQNPNKFEMMKIELFLERAFIIVK